MPSADEPQTSARDRRVASRVAAKFGPFRCDDCAAEIIKALGRESGARVARIRTDGTTEIIDLVKTRLPISYNSFHVGVLVGDRIFDNLHAEGVPAEEWPRRFFTQNGTLLNSCSQQGK